VTPEPETETPEQPQVASVHNGGARHTPYAAGVGRSRCGVRMDRPRFTDEPVDCGRCLAIEDGTYGARLNDRAHVCQPLEIDGRTVSVHADPKLSDTDRAYLSELVRAAVKMHDERL
jgi:hypothetical protein